MTRARSLLWICVFACSKQAPARSDSASAPRVTGPLGTLPPAGRRDSIVFIKGDSGVKYADPILARDACPATGRWAVCSVVYRLDRTGLVPALDSNGVAQEPKLARSGTRIAIGSRAELALFIYPDKKSREADEAHLDKSQFLSGDDAQTMDHKRTLIENENLLAILTSLDDHQRERVANALESGPPQAAKR